MRSHDLMSASTEFLSWRHVRCSALLADREAVSGSGVGAPLSRPGRSKKPPSAQQIDDLQPGIMQQQYTDFEQSGQQKVSPNPVTVLKGGKAGSKPVGLWIAESSRARFKYPPFGRAVQTREGRVAPHALSQRGNQPKPGICCPLRR